MNDYDIRISIAAAIMFAIFITPTVILWYRMRKEIREDDQ